jgi:hypothetical protein
MSTYRITIIIDDTVAAQASLLTQIQNTLASIAANKPIGLNNIEVQKIA